MCIVVTTPERRKRKMINLTNLYLTLEKVEIEKFDGRQDKVAEAMGISAQSYSMRKKRVLEGRVTLKTLMEFEEKLGISLLSHV